MPVSNNSFNAAKRARDTDIILRDAAIESGKPEIAAAADARINAYQAVMNQEQSTYDLWKDGGLARIGLHAAAGAMIAQGGGGGSGITGAVVAAGNEIMVAKLGELTKDLPLPEELRKDILRLASTVAGAAIAGVAGGSANDIGMGATIAQSATENNYLKHEQAKALGDKLRACKSGGCSKAYVDGLIADAEKESSKNNQALVNCPDQACRDAHLASKATAGEMGVLYGEIGSVGRSSFDLAFMQSTAGPVNLSRAAEVKRIEMQTVMRDNVLTACQGLTGTQCAAKFEANRDALKIAIATGVVIALAPELIPVVRAARIALAACASNVMSASLCAQEASIIATDLATQGALGPAGAGTLGAAGLGSISARAASQAARTEAQVLEDILVAARREAGAIDSLPAGFRPVNLEGLPVGSRGIVNNATSEVLIIDAKGSITQASIRTGNPVYDAPVLSHADGTIWTPDNKVRGALGEELVERNSRGIGLHNNEPVIDVFVPQTGEAVSIKTLDWNTPSRIAKPETLESLVKGQVNELVNYEGTNRVLGGQLPIPNESIQSRTLELILPATGGTAAQVAAISRAIDYAQQNGIVVKVIRAN